MVPLTLLFIITNKFDFEKKNIAITYINLGNIVRDFRAEARWGNRNKCANKSKILLPRKGVTQHFTGSSLQDRAQNFAS